MSSSPSLIALLAQQLQESVRRSNQDYQRLVVGGLPREVLASVFSALTDTEDSLWEIAEDQRIPFFLVKRDPKADGSGTSRECNWDYALAIRNSFPSFLLLVDTDVWDDRTYSIINATEAISIPLPPVRRSVPPLKRWSPFYARLAHIAAESVGLSATSAESAIRECLKDLPQLDPEQQHLYPWHILDRIANLSETNAVASHDDLAKACGLLAFGAPSGNFSNNRAMLVRLARFLEGGGIGEGFEELKATTIGNHLSSELEALHVHLRRSAGSASAFLRAPCFYYAIDTLDPSVWNELTVGVIDELLTEVGSLPEDGTIVVSCPEALNLSPASGEPYLVRDEVYIQATHSTGNFQSFELSRGTGAQREHLMNSSETVSSPISYMDAAIPDHKSTLTYQVKAPGAPPGSLKVISLAHYEPQGFVTCPGPSTRRLSKPRRRQVATPWKQDFFFRVPGHKTFRVFCGSSVHRVKTFDSPEYQADCFVIDGMTEFTFLIDVDVEISLELTDVAGEVVSTIVLCVALDQESTDSEQSQFHALVRSHQDLRSTPPPTRSRRTWLRALEGELMEAESSWHPVLATPGWSNSKPQLADTFQLGSVPFQLDPRPRMDPSPDFLDAREEVMDWLRSSSLPMTEMDLADAKAIQLAEGYLRAYREWCDASPGEACWVDTVSILESEAEQYSDQGIAAFQPIAVLASPFHPIRFGWHVAAQRILRSGLDLPCPLAGLLDPHRSPEVLSMALARSGGEPRWTAYVSVSCQDPMWALFWDSMRLRDLQQHDAVAELVVAGVNPRGVQSGFTASQANKTLDEISHVLPTRAILRIGIVGAGRGTTSCTEGLMEWSREKFDKEDESLSGPRSIELFDSRNPDSQPSNQEISSLADHCGHQVRWFSQSSETPARDLVIVDQLGMASPVVERHEWMSPSLEGSLIRSRIRLDRNEAELVIESRAGDIAHSNDGLLRELGLAVGQMEHLAKDRCACSHVAFVPHRQVVSDELHGTRFLAVSSTEIDPACFARGVPRAEGYLWDYEWPYAVGPGEQRSGFYLIARPPEAMRRAVLRAIDIVSQTNIDVEALLAETSRRGIPILKRLAAGGSLARGELGMLLAVRLLQDSFRTNNGVVRLPVYEDGTIRMVLPVDPYSALLDRIRQGLHKQNSELTAATRPDLLVVCIRTNGKTQTQIRLVPLEVKFRDSRMSASERESSLEQANNLGKILHCLLSAPAPNELWRVCGLAFLSEVLDHGFRVYGDPSVSGKSPDEWVEIHQGCLSNIANNRVTISVAEEGRLLVFDQSPTSSADDVDGDDVIDTLVISRDDARALLEDDTQLSGCVDEVIELLSFCDVESDHIESGSGSDMSAMQETFEESGSNLEHLQPSNDTQTNLPSNLGSFTISPSTREQVEAAFSSFIGNRAAIDTLKRGILKAMLSDPPQLPASYLLTGNPSTGKTELSRRIARALALPFVSLDGRSLGSRERLFDLIDDRLQDSGLQAEEIGVQYQRPELVYPPLVVFVDEVHLVPRSVQESLLTALEPTDRSVLLENRLVRLPQITFLFATTRPSEIDAAFRTRCTEVYLEDYTEDEVATIVQLDYPHWPEALRRRISRYGRLVPRIALEFARELANEALVSAHQERDLNGHLDEVRRTRLVDENGLTRVDIEYLELLEREDGPLGERNILTMLGNIDKDRFIEEVEPLVVARMGLVRRTGRGRELTREGRRYLIDMRKAQADSR